MGMILEYDQSPNATVDQKVGTLKDSVQRALEDVEQNVEGKPGTPGVGIEEIIEQWCLSSSRLSPVGAWGYEQAEWKPGYYLWTRNEVRYTDGSIKYTTPGLADALNKAYEAAYAAGDWQGEMEGIVSTIEQTVAGIEQLADEAKALAAQANTLAESAKKQAGQAAAEIDVANQQVEMLAQELETLDSTMKAGYATKGELTEVNTALGTRVSQNAAQISQTASAVQQVDINAAQALQDAEDAAAAAAAAQQNANEAQNKYDGLKQQADATDEQLEAAKQAVEKAQADAVAAGDAAAAAASAANALSDRVTAAETSITQNAESISLVAESVSSMKIGGRNYVLESRDTRDGETSKIAGFELSEPWEEGQVYTLSFEGEKASGVFAAYRDDGITLVSGGMPFNEMTGRYECTFMCPAQAAADTAGNILTIYNMPSGISTGGNVGFVKLEKGNRATDWTPAPEDGVDYTNDAIASATTKILQTAEDVTIGIMAGYTSSSDFEKYRQEVENLFRANEDGFAFEFSQLEGRITAAQNEIVQRSQFIRLEGGNIIIGNSDSPVQAKFTNDALEFSYNGQTVARFTNEVLEVENISVSNQVRFGSEWAIRPGQYITGKGSNLDDVWIGG